MASIQHTLTRLRAPRVQLTYDVEIGDASVAKELPFVMGIMADLSGHRAGELPKIKERKFIEIDGATFGDVMTSIKPRLAFKVPNLIPGKSGVVAVEMTFDTMDDFGPLALIQKIPGLKEVHSARIQLNDLLSALDGNDEMEAALIKAMEQKKGDGSDPAMGAFVDQVKAAGDDVGNNPFAFISKRIQHLDEVLSNQVDAVLHNKDFQKLEGAWRGLHYLVKHSETGKTLILRLLNASKQEIADDLDKAIEFDQSQLFKKIYEEEYGTFGGAPYSCLLADFEFGRSGHDITMLRNLSTVAAAAHAPLFTAADPALFGLNNFTELGVPRDLHKVFEHTELARWRAFRASEDSRYVVLTLPHVLMRDPYGPNTSPIEGINYVENVDGADNSKFCWGNAAYALASRVTAAAAEFNWTTAIRGVEGGGLVTGLPAYSFKTADGDTEMKCPTEVPITDRREKELSDLGFIALCHAKNSSKAVFFGAQTAQQPKVYDTPEATANALLSSRITYMLAASRFAHYIKAMIRDKVGSFMSKADMSLYLNTWIAKYILLSDEGSQAVKARYPLREARVDVTEVPGEPGFYRAIIYLRPHFQLEGMAASIRLVAELPAPLEEEEEGEEEEGEESEESEDEGGDEGGEE
ncbi:MAG: type VI secretion system contractile sheath large subunit [bacterium]|nr:type VI secretion system contractile sheath large subunit [bacterium]